MVHFSKMMKRVKMDLAMMVMGLIMLDSRYKKNKE